MFEIELLQEKLALMKKVNKKEREP